jgi:hypothetical protein
MRTMRTMTLLCGLLLTATLASAQPQPQKQPPRPAQPQDPTPIPVPIPLSPAGQKPDPTSKEPMSAGSGKSEKNDKSDKSEATATGCLQRAEEPSGAASESGRLVGGYILKQATATRAKEAPGGARGETTATGTKEYRIVAGNDSIKLAAHVGHQVEVTGRISLDQPASPTSTDTATSTSRPSGSTGVSTQPSTGAQPTMPPVTLSVTSIKMVASTCTTPTS